jgi:hypothetical protein
MIPNIGRGGMLWPFCPNEFNKTCFGRTPIPSSKPTKHSYNVGMIRELSVKLCGERDSLCPLNLRIEFGSLNNECAGTDQGLLLIYKQAYIRN